MVLVDLSTIRALLAKYGSKLRVNAVENSLGSTSQLVLKMPSKKPKTKNQCKPTKQGIKDAYRKVCTKKQKTRHFCGNWPQRSDREELRKLKNRNQ